MKGKTGGVAFIMKISLVCEMKICDSEDVCFLSLQLNPHTHHVVTTGFEGQILLK